MLTRLLLLAVCFTLPAHAAGAVEIAGVKLDNRVRVDSRELLLNGAGIRTKFFFKVYVAGLYLPEKATGAEAVLNQAGEKRLAMFVLREISAEHLNEAFNNSITANNSTAELAPLKQRLADFNAVFAAAKAVNPGDVITLDYLPDVGTRVAINGAVKQTIPGADFNRTLLKIWLGEKPVDSSLKKGLLGE